MLKKLLTALLKHVARFLKKLGCTLDELLDIVVRELGEVVDLDSMTIAELRTFAKTRGISLKGKRVKEEIVKIIKEHMEV